MSTPLTLPPAGAPNKSWMIGDHYDDTADLTLLEVARRIDKDLHDVQSDGELPECVDFKVTADTNGPINVLHVVITERCTVDPQIRQETMHNAFVLANHYNYVYVDHPEQTRFIQHITVVDKYRHPIMGLVGMMWDDFPGYSPNTTVSSEALDSVA